MLAVAPSTRSASLVAQGDEAPATCALLLSSRDPHRQVVDGVWLRLHGSLDNLAELAERSGAAPGGDGACQPAEVVRRCYRLWGSCCFARLRGSFACAILDLRQQKLLLARDHAGSRSLYYSAGDGFCFASTIEAILSLRGPSRRANLPVLRRWLLELPNDDPAQTFFEGILKLPPASVLELDLNQPTLPSVSPYWTIPENANCTMERSAAEVQLRTLLGDSLEQTIGEAAPVGVALSGGLDSSVVLAALRERKGKTYPIECFTAVTEAAASRVEESRAQTAAALCGARIRLVHYDCRRIPGEIDAMVRSLEEPVASPVLFAHRELYRAAQSAGVALLLNGHGADSLFAGSNSHLLKVAEAMLRQGKPLRACALLAHAPGRARLLRSLIAGLLPAGIRSAFHRKTTPEWLNAGWFRQREARPGEEAEMHSDGRRLSLRAQRIRELQALSLPHALRFEERAGEAEGICGRSPYLAPELMEFAFTIPDSYLIGSDGSTKSILRSAFADRLPDEIWSNGVRIGFPVPAAIWLCSLRDWSEEEVAKIEDVPFIGMDQVRELWKRVQTAETEGWKQAMELWRLIFLCRWVKEFGIEL